MRGGLRRRSIVSAAMIGLFLLLIAFAAPGASLARGDEIRLALRPVGQVAPWFDLTMKPGERRTFDVDISNVGDATISACTYAADVYTIINGGFGGRLRGQAQSGTTRWLDYPTDVLGLAAGRSLRRSFAVMVPADAAPGEYITSLVLENDQPIRTGGSVAVDQIVRQAVAVVVTIPGARSPGLVIGAATHSFVGGTSIVSVAVENTGNIRLKPVVAFALFDAAGAEVSRASVQMETFYARTSTHVEVPLAAPLPPGTYTVRFSLDDVTQGAAAARAAIPLLVAAPALASAGTVPDAVAAPTLAGKVPDEIAASVPVPLLVGGVVSAGIVIGLVGLVVLVLARRRRARA
jgi:hypothetical protein